MSLDGKSPSKDFNLLFMPSLSNYLGVNISSADADLTVLGSLIESIIVSSLSEL